MPDFATSLRELSEPRPPGDAVKAAIERAARRAGLSYWRAFDIWYSKARRVEPHEIEQITTALKARDERALANEFHEVKVRMARIEAMLNARDADFHRPDADYYRAQASGPGFAGGAMGRRK